MEPSPSDRYPLNANHPRRFRLNARPRTWPCRIPKRCSRGSGEEGERPTECRVLAPGGRRDLATTGNVAVAELEEGLMPKHAFAHRTYLPPNQAVGVPGLRDRNASQPVFRSGATTPYAEVRSFAHKGMRRFQCQSLFHQMAY